MHDYKQEDSCRLIYNCLLNLGEVVGKILSSRKSTGGESTLIPRQGKDVQMCLSRRIIKRVTRQPWCCAITAKSGIMSRTRGSSVDLLRPLLPASHTRPPSLLRPPPTYPYTRVRRRFRLLIKTRVREGFQGFLLGSPPRGRDVGGWCVCG